MTNAWLIAWALAYIVAGIAAPQISGNVLEGQILYLIMGVLLLAPLAMLESIELPGFDPDREHTVRTLATVLLIALAFVSLYSAVASWSGMFVWNVPFPDKSLFQVTMGLMDFVGAVFMLIRAIS